MNRYRVILRDSAEYYVEAVGFEMKDGWAVLSRADSDVAVFSGPDLVCVMLVAEGVKSDGDRPANIHRDRFAGARIA